MMKIPHPWPHCPHVRIVCKPGDIVVVASTRGDLEVPDGTTEALITPVTNPPQDGPFLIWSKEFGLLDVRDHETKLELKGESQKMEASRKARLEEEEDAPELDEAGAQEALEDVRAGRCLTAEEILGELS